MTISVKAQLRGASGNFKARTYAAFQTALGVTGTVT